MAAALLCALLAIAPHGREGDAQAFTALTDLQGHALANARYAQRVEGDRLFIESRADFPSGRSIVEHATLRLRPRLQQESWDWTERENGRTVREYSVDFLTRRAVAMRSDQGKRWIDEDVEVELGKTFAGIGFIPVVKSLRAELTPGQQVELKVVAMTPRPRTATVSVRRDGPSIVRMANRVVEGDRYTIHPEVPAIAKLFVNAPDQHIWLLADDPPAFLRFEGPMVEPDDPIVHIDLIPGAPARGQGRAPRRRPR
jgi:hypothetical protein